MAATPETAPVPTPVPVYAQMVSCEGDGDSCDDRDPLLKMLQAQRYRLFDDMDGMCTDFEPGPHYCRNYRGDYTMYTCPFVHDEKRIRKIQSRRTDLNKLIQIRHEQVRLERAARNGWGRPRYRQY
jgi:hypothetical protein